MVSMVSHHGLPFPSEGYMETAFLGRPRPCGGKWDPVDIFVPAMATKLPFERLNCNPNIHCGHCWANCGLLYRDCWCFAREVKDGFMGAAEVPDDLLKYGSCDPWPCFVGRDIGGQIDDIFRKIFWFIRLMSTAKRVRHEASPLRCSPPFLRNAGAMGSPTP